MKEDPKDQCGVGVFGFRGWALEACKAHDRAYLKGSVEQTTRSRKEQDAIFWSDLMRLADKTRWPNGARLMGGIMWGVTRLLGGRYWEGRR